MIDPVINGGAKSIAAQSISMNYTSKSRWQGPRGPDQEDVHWSWPVVTRKRVSKEEKKQSQEWAMKQIDKGVGFSELASLMAETRGCSRRQARRVVADAHKEWMDVCFGADDIDQRDPLFQCVAHRCSVR